MKSPRQFLILVICAAPLLRADVTIRYKTEMKSAAPIPVPDGATHEIRMKGNKGATSDGGEITIMDFATQQITVVDKTRRKFATLPASEYGSTMAAAIPQLDSKALAPGSVKNKVESRMTGRTESILGVNTEERETTVSIEIPLPEPMPAQAITMRMVTEDWSATAAESLRVPAVHQLMGFNLWQEYFMSGAETLRKMLPADNSSLVDALKTSATTLRRSMKMYMDGPGLDSGTPFMEMNYEVVDLSTAAVDDALFEVPPGFEAISFGDLINGQMQDHRNAAKRPSSQEPKAIPAGIQAYVPQLTPLQQNQPALPEEARLAGVQGTVELLLTLDPAGLVTGAEALTGPEMLRQPAVEAVMNWTYRPVLRNGAPVAAYTDATVYYLNRSTSKGRNAESLSDLMAANQRRTDLETALPRTPAQKLADLEQDSQGPDKLRRFYALNKLAEAALKAGDDEKAAAYARELLNTAPDFPKDWNFGNAIFDGHLALGLLAVRKDDVATARAELLESAKTPGSPTLNSFGPNMALAEALLRKGERGAVLEFLTSCGVFWKMGQERLQAWANTINQGGTPVFGTNLH